MHILNPVSKVRRLPEHERDHAAYSEEGSAAVASVAAVLALALVLAIAATLSSAVGHRVHAQGTANLAALAAAVEWAYLGAADPCGRAREVAVQNAAVLTECETHGSSVQVTVKLETKTLNQSATATGRAGPRE